MLIAGPPETQATDSRRSKHFFISWVNGRVSGLKLRLQFGNSQNYKVTCIRCSTFLQISANDDCPGNRTRYSESHETKTSSHIDNKKKTRGSKFATDKLIEIKIHNFQLFTSFESIQSHSWRGGACEEQVSGGN